MDEGFALGAEGGDGEGHGDAVVSAGVDGCAVGSLTAGNVQAVFELFDLDAHGAEVAGDEGDAIGLLDAELLGVADADAVAGVGGDGGEDGQFVDELGGECSGDGGAAEAVVGRVHLDGADEFAIFLFEIEDGDGRAEGGEDVEEGGAGGVESEVVEDKVGVGKEGCGAEEEGGGGHVSGDGGLDGFEALAAGDGDGVEGAGDFGSEGA